MEDRIVKGIWIPIEIWKDADLSWNEKILLMEIDSYTSQDKDCFISDEYIADLLTTSLRNASRMVTNLVDKGYIERSRFDGRRRYLRSLIRYNRFGKPDTTKMANQIRQECQNTNTDYLNSLDKSKHTHSTRAKKFVKPSLEEIILYCRERNNRVDPERFFNYYESKGWVVGKSPMKDWKAAVRTWEQTESQTPQRRQPAGRRKDTFREQVETAERMFGSEYAKQMFGVSFLDQDQKPEEQ